MLTPETIADVFGIAPREVSELSRTRVENVAYFGTTAYMQFAMFNGVSHYLATVPYEAITLQ